MMKHPSGLPMLFATEMWERFSFYTMQALLVLYATATFPDGGLGMSSEQAIYLYGLYVAASYIAPVLGGYVADRFIGMQVSVVLGGLMMAAGQYMLMAHHTTLFVAALAVLALGNGFFKPCISSLLGCLYEDRPALRDSGYSIFYVGINLGAFCAGLAGGVLQEHYGFQYAFAAAGTGMLVGLTVFLWGKVRYLGTLGLKAPHRQGADQAVRLTSLERKRVTVICLLAALIAVFFTAFWQHGGSLTLYAEWYTDRYIPFLGMEIPTAWFFSLNPLFILAFGPLASVVWKRLAKISPRCFDVKKMVLGYALTALSFAFLSVQAGTVMGEGGVKSSMWVLVLFSALVTAGELCIVPVALSLVSKIAPEAYLSRLMSVVLASTGVGALTASKLGSKMELLGPSEVFMVIAVINAAVVLILLPISWKLESWCDGQESLHPGEDIVSASA